MSGSGSGSLGYGMTVPDGEAGRHGHAPLSTGAIVAIAFGAAAALLLLLAAILVLVYCCCCRKRRAAAGQRRAEQALAIRVDVVPERSSGAALSAGSGAAGTSSGGAVGGGGDAGCRMCRAGHGGEPPVALECGHSFHRRCIRRWLRHNSTCPPCNATTIALIGDTSLEAIGSQMQTPRLSVDDSASTHELMEIRGRCSSSRF